MQNGKKDFHHEDEDNYGLWSIDYSPPTIFGVKSNPFLVILGTWFYTGYIPFAPGTFASLVALPLIILLHNNLSAYLVLLIIVLVIGTIAAHELGKVWKRKDDQRITVDEVLGMLVTFLLISPIKWYSLLIGFILFRFFDIVKPLFIRQTEQVKGGIGVMLDDLLAGVYANIGLRLLLLVIGGK